MKYYILLIYLLAFSLATEGNTAVKDSLSEALPSASSPLQKLEIMTNLMDLSRQEEQVEYAKQLYWLALEEDEDYYKEAALTEILRFYVNTDAKDSAKVYLAEAERELKGKARDFLVTYMKTIMDVRVVYYTKGEDRMKLIEKYKLRLETEKDMPVLDKISNYYLLGMANSNRVDPKNQDAIYKEVCYYMNNLIELSDNIPLRYSYLFRLNTLNILSLMEATPENRVKASLRYLNMQKEYADTKEMKKRPYTSKRHLLNAYSTLATAAETVGKDMATYYFNYFIDLNRKYPEDAAFSAEYDRYFTSLNYYKSIRDFQKAADYNDSVIYYFRHGDFQFDLTENIVLTLKDKIDCLDSLHRYKDAYEAYKEYSVLLDSARTRSMENKVEDLEIKKYVDELVVEKKALEIDLQKSRSQLYLFLALLILSICFGIFIFFRPGKIKSLYKELQESNRLVIIASEKAQESERMKNAFIKNMCHEVRTPLNAINGFAELITSDGISPEEKKEFSKIIYTNCHNITSMMNDVLVIAQLDSSNEVLPLEPVHISLLCHHEMNKLKKLQQKPDIHYQVEGDKSNDLIYSDPNHFGIIISHLLNNANKFTNQGSITLSYQPEEEGRIMCICVTDTGCGIPADKSEWIFERFTKNDDFIPGSGLGLYLCRLITQRLNGSLKLDTCYTGGARFILRLPINPYK
ncbi:sensor histidine kinase [Parabacteroides merdae]|uniref:sensor histidine kinase n=1 Tax=Parabacteroides merdae TaxID=46503 RepID=UPI0022E780CF|nr:HAMP domain-containing sensor histidine kinase [Parabacteroides merdae]